MKKLRNKILGGIATLFLVIAIVLNVNINAKKSSLSDMLLANVEALAQSDAYGGDAPYWCCGFFSGMCDWSFHVGEFRVTPC